MVLTISDVCWRWSGEVDVPSVGDEDVERLALPEKGFSCLLHRRQTLVVHFEERYLASCSLGLDFINDLSTCLVISCRKFSLL